MVPSRACAPVRRRRARACRPRGRRHLERSARVSISCAAPAIETRLELRTGWYAAPPPIADVASAARLRAQHRARTRGRRRSACAASRPSRRPRSGVASSRSPSHQPPSEGIRTSSRPNSRAIRSRSASAPSGVPISPVRVDERSGPTCRIRRRRAQAFEPGRAARGDDHPVPGAEQRPHDGLADAAGSARDQDLLHPTFPTRCTPRGNEYARSCAKLPALGHGHSR